jgi:site-specific DNA-methyltransferase (adenine-specific)
MNKQVMTLIQGDCLEEMKKIESGSVDCVIVDPPYTMTKRGKSCRPNWMPNNMGDNVFNAPIPKAKEWMSELFRVMKDETHFYTFCNTNDLQNYLNTAKECGFKFHNLITIIKDTGMPNRWYYKQCELLLFFRKGKAKPINDMTSRDNINVVMPKKSTGKLHITEKPLDLIEKLVFNSSTDNEVVLDPFMGSGTTGVACKNLNRNFIGIELDENYFNIAKDRIENHIVQEELT